jgi:hypothetical protein
MIEVILVDPGTHTNVSCSEHLQPHKQQAREGRKKEEQITKASRGRDRTITWSLQSPLRRGESSLARSRSVRRGDDTDACYAGAGGGGQDYRKGGANHSQSPCFSSVLTDNFSSVPSQSHVMPSFSLFSLSNRTETSARLKPGPMRGGAWTGDRTERTATGPAPGFEKAAAVRQAVERRGRSCSWGGRGAAGRGAGTNSGWRQGRDEAASGDGAGCGGEEVAGRGAATDGRSGRGGIFWYEARGGRGTSTRSLIRFS